MLQYSNFDGGMCPKYPLPFGMLSFSKANVAEDRNFMPLPKSWSYDPKSQLSDLPLLMGKDTWSRVSSTYTGKAYPSQDPDEDRDD